MKRWPLLLALIAMELVASAAWAGKLERQAQEALQAHHTQRARDLYRRLVTRHPNNLDYLLWAARLSAWTHDYPAALAYYDRAIAQAPADADPLIGKAYVLMWQGRLDSAKSLLVRAAKIGPAGSRDLSQARAAYRRYADAAAQARLRQAARGAVAAHDFKRAKVLYGQLARRAPENVEYRLWIARLESWTGHYEQAVRDYRAILREHPEDVDGWVGLSYTLTWMGQARQAAAAITRAQQLAPDSNEVRMAAASYYHSQDRDDMAASYVSAVLVREPDNREARALQSELEAPHPWQLNLGYQHDWFTFVTPGNVYSVSAGYEGSANRIFLIYQCWDRFHAINHRGGISLAHKLARRTWVHGQALLAPGASIIPREDLSAGLSRGLPFGIALASDYRYLHFPGTDVHILSPSFDYYFSSYPIWLHFALYETFTDIHPKPVRDDQSYLVEYNQQWRNLLTFHLGYAYGNESFSEYTADRIGTFSSHTAFAGLDLLTSETSRISLFYSFQDRSTGDLLNSFGLTLTLRR